MKTEWGVLRRGVIFGLGVRGCLMATGLATGILLARSLPREQLGAWYLLLQWATIGVLLTTFGTGTSLQRFFSLAPAGGGRRCLARLARRAALLVALSTGVFALAAVLLWGPMAALFASRDLALLLPALLLLAGAGAAEEIVSVFFRSTGKPRLGIFLLEAPRQLLFLGGLLALILSGPGLDVTQVATLRVAAALLSAAVGVFLVVRDVTGRASTGDIQAVPGLGGLAIVSAPMLVHLLSSQLLIGADLLFVGGFLGAGQAGIYGSMVRVAALAGALLAAVNAVLPPTLAKLHAEGRHQELEALMRRAATLTGAGAAAAGLSLAAFGPWVVRLLFGPGFEAGCPALAILAAAQAFSALAGSPGWLLQMAGKQVVLMRITLATLCVHLPLTYLGVRIGGISGAAAAAALTIVIQNLAMVAAVRRTLGVRTYAILKPQPSLALPQRR